MSGVFRTRAKNDSDFPKRSEGFSAAGVRHSLASRIALIAFFGFVAFVGFGVFNNKGYFLWHGSWRTRDFTVLIGIIKNREIVFL